ncbi:MAG: aldolase [Planctomycetes bacterium]|nr:aldolase [Planctomycetota bacterium]
MGIGKQIRINRLFAHPSGRMCSVAMDHFINYGTGILPPGLRETASTLAEVIRGGPDAMTIHRGVIETLWAPYAGRIPLIIQSTILRIDDSFVEYIAGPEDAVRLGADAIAVVGFVRGATEGRYMKGLSDMVRAAAPFDFPVVAHVYPRRFDKGVDISYESEDIAWAVRCAFECGIDIIKVPYPNDRKAFAEIVANTPVPIVAAGGPKKDRFEDWLALVGDAVAAGARGATVGRNVWGAARIAEALRAIKDVVHGEAGEGAS